MAAKFIEHVHDGEWTVSKMMTAWGVGRTTALKRLRALEKAGRLGKPVRRRNAAGRAVMAWSRK